jgi:photosystem II stability/assembly factor-like uncharacterized protein
MRFGGRRVGERWLVLAGLAVVSIVIGAGIAIGGSYNSLRESSDRALQPVEVTRAPTPKPPTPTPFARVEVAGLLARAPAMTATSRTALSLSDGRHFLASHDGGVTWTQLTPAANLPRLVIDPGNPLHLLAAGSGIQTSSDGGKTWSSPRVTPPGGGFTPVGLNPGDAQTWFLTQGANLIRTRDGGQSWRTSFAGLAPISAPVFVASGSPDQFLLATPTHVYVLVDNGQQIVDRGELPGGASVVQLAPAGNDAILARGSDGKVYLGRGTAWSGTAAPLSGSIATWPGHFLVGDGGGRLGRPADVVVSQDGGATWQHATGLPPDQSVEALAAASDGTAFAYCYGGDVFESDDGGHTWRLVSSALRSPAPSPSPSPS